MNHFGPHISEIDFSVVCCFYLSYTLFGCATMIHFERVMRERGTDFGQMFAR